MGNTAGHAVGLAPPGPGGTGPAGRILLGGPGLRYPGPYTAGIQSGWLVLLAAANTGRRAVRGADVAVPLAFVFPGRPGTRRADLPAAGRQGDVPVIPRSGDPPAGP